MRLAPRIYGSFYDTVAGQDKVKKRIKMRGMIGIKQMAELVQHHKFDVFQWQAQQMRGQHNACFLFFVRNFAGTKTALAGSKNQCWAKVVIRCCDGMLQTKMGCFFLKDFPKLLIIPA